MISGLRLIGKDFGKDHPSIQVDIPCRIKKLSTRTIIVRTASEMTKNLKMDLAKEDDDS
jgi:hypothetical protein